MKRFHWLYAIQPTTTGTASPAAIQKTKLRHDVPEGGGVSNDVVGAGVRGAGDAGATGRPQLAQNRAPADNGFPHDSQ
jgi:hypothetical protein